MKHTSAMAVKEISDWLRESGLSPNKDCFHTTGKCVFWILIRNANFESKLERLYWWIVCTPNHIAMRNLSKSGAFQITVQRCFPELYAISETSRSINHCMNALTSKAWFGGAELSDLLTTSMANIPRAAYVQKHRKCELHACFDWTGYPDILLPLECKFSPN